MPTKRQTAMQQALTELTPFMPFSDAEAIRPKLKRGAMRDLPPKAAVWLCTIAHIRHHYTEYDAMLKDGYSKDEARFFIVDAINATLEEWHATRRLISTEDLSQIDAQLEA